MARGGSPSETPMCIDGRMLRNGGTGVSTYAKALAGAISRLTTRPYILHACPQNAVLRTLRAVLPLAHQLQSPVSGGDCILQGRDVFRTAHVHFKLNRRLYRLRSDLAPGIMHWSYPVPIMLEGWINIYTVHDTIPLDHPDLSPIDPRRHRAVLAAIVEHGDRIVTVSADARTSIIHALGLGGRPDFVVDAGQAVDLSEELAQLPVSAIPGAPLAGTYLLCVGSIEPRKNLSAILEAYKMSGVTMPLLIAGPDSWRAEPILAQIAQTPGARRLPYQSRAALLGLLRNARALIFPTLAEGFGLPVIEAMALGTPVLTSNRGALAEVAGEAALTVDPTDLAAISVAFRWIATDDGLALQLGQQGKVRALAFSTARFTDRLRAIYDETLSNSQSKPNACVR